MGDALSLTPDGLDQATVETLLQTKYPDVKIERLHVVDAAIHGQQQVSTSQRVAFEVEYGDGAPSDLPRRLLVKMARPGLGDLPLYDIEVNVYMHLGDELPVNTPRCLGAVRDVEGSAFALALEDLRASGAQFPSVLTPATPGDIKLLLDQLAHLHAAYWQSPRLETEFTWLHPHTEGPIHEVFTHPAGLPMFVQWEVSSQQFKRELVESVDETAETLPTKVAIAQAHQATLPLTVVHGDAHFGNTYVLPDGTRGLLDWQLTARGYCMHDITYMLITGLSVRDRRNHEKDLIAYYRDRLVSYGVSDAPSVDELTHEHRIAAAWCFYVGWLSTPLENYGWEISVANHIRLATAYRDLDSGEAISALAT